MSWYPFYLLCVGVLWAFSSPRDRNALRILLIAGIGSSLLMGALHQVIWSGKLIVPATVECVTILALLTWARNRTGWLQAGFLVIAWGTHLLCYYDLMTNTNLVYDAYESILGLVAVGQLLACYDSALHIWTTARDAVIRWRRARNLSVAGVCDSVLSSKGSESL